MNKIGVYKIVSKAAPKKVLIIGTANIEAYWCKNGDKSLTYELIWECNKFELPRYTAHFQKIYAVLPEKEKVIKETAIIKTPVTMETAVIEEIPVIEEVPVIEEEPIIKEEPVIEVPVIKAAPKKKVVRKKRVKK